MTNASRQYKELGEEEYAEKWEDLDVGNVSFELGNEDPDMDSIQDGRLGNALQALKDIEPEPEPVTQDAFYSSLFQVYPPMPMLTSMSTSMSVFFVICGYVYRNGQTWKTWRRSRS